MRHRLYTLMACFLAIILAMSVGCTKAGTPAEKTPAGKIDESAHSDYSATFQPDENAQETPETMQAGKTSEGKEIISFVNINIGTDFLAGEITGAKLYLTAAGSAQPKKLRLGLIKKFWDESSVTYDEALTLADEFREVEVTAEPDGRLSVPLTDYIKLWTSGARQNNGVAILSDADNETYSFVSAMATEKEKETPSIIIQGEAGNRPLTYGKFAFTEITADETHSNGNCMAYALRDMNDIVNTDIGADTKKMASLYTEAGAGKGIDALTDYFVQLASAYVDTHKDGLKISQLRPLEAFDAEIDPQTEYRIAMRIGVHLPTDETSVDFSIDRSYDYHFWAQLNDGQWTQKFAGAPSSVVSCSGPGISPGNFAWDAGDERNPKSADFYTGPVKYFAVTKDTDEFTRHRGETEDRPLS